MSELRDAKKLKALTLPGPGYSFYCDNCGWRNPPTVPGTRVTKCCMKPIGDGLGDGFYNTDVAGMGGMGKTWVMLDVRAQQTMTHMENFGKSG